MVVDCSRFDSFDFLLDVGVSGMFFRRVFDLGSGGEDEVVGSVLVSVRGKEGLRRLLDGFLDGRA